MYYKEKRRIERERKALLEYFIKNGIKDDSELDFYMRCYLGWNIPKNSFCEGHVSPFKFISDMFFEKTLSSFLFANRTGGKTLNVAILNHLDATFKPGVEISSAGASRDQAGRCYNYFLDIYRNPLFSSHLKMERGQPKTSQRRTELWNNSIIQVITGSEKGFRSPHSQKVRIDEIELLTWDLLQTAMSISLSKGNIVGQDTYLSTRQKAHGVVQRLLDSADDLEIRVYKYCIWEILEKCDRKCFGDPKYGNCPIYSRKFGKTKEERLVCGGKAHDISDGGWYPIQDFIKKAINMNWDTLATEWFCLRPGGGETVYGDYLSDEQFATWQRFKNLTGFDKIPKNWRFVSGIDFGSRFVYVKFAIDPHGNWWGFWSYYYDAYIQGDRTTLEHAKVIKTSPYFGLPEFIYGDKSAKQSIADMRAEGISIEPAENDVFQGISAVKDLLSFDSKGNPKLRFITNSGDNIKIKTELETYLYGRLDDGRTDYENVIKEEDHACFVAGTKILTFDGWKSIEKIKIGEKVFTRNGFKEVLATGLTGYKPVYEYNFHGFSFISTKDHPIFLREGNKKKADLLSNNDYPFVLNYGEFLWHVKQEHLKLLNLMGRCLEGIQDLKTEEIEIIIEQMGLREILYLFIEKYGNFIMGKFQKILIFIIKTVILLIIQLKIWKLKINPIICPFILKNSLRRMRVGVGTKGHLLRKFAEIAGRNSLLKYLINFFVPLCAGININGINPDINIGIGVEKNLESTILKGFVLNAEKNLIPINTEKLEVVLDHVQQKQDGKIEGIYRGKQFVYNLTVEEDHEYYANGILVCNCDAIRYAIYSMARRKGIAYRTYSIPGI